VLTFISSNRKILPSSKILDKFLKLLLIAKKLNYVWHDQGED